MIYRIDALYIYLLLPAIVLAFWAQIKVGSTYKKYSKVPTRSGMTGYDSARMILDRNGLYHVQIEQIRGELTDHFDPRSNTVRLSSSVYEGTSAAAIGVASHEAGHAVQYAVEYAPMKIRSAIIPVTNFGATLAFPLFLMGIFLAIPTLAYVGVAAFGLSTIFQLVTLPVEFNASNRALSALRESHRFSEEEIKGAGKVLSAAALTYVAALAVSLANLLRLLVLANGSRRR
ncbi:MAG: zinc metallopeptidase [Clostridiales bacterium]|nr:zinc metallopeptidase [Clostridiales bacterium]